MPEDAILSVDPTPEEEKAGADLVSALKLAGFNVNNGLKAALRIRVAELLAVHRTQLHQGLWFGPGKHGHGFYIDGNEVTMQTAFDYMEMLKREAGGPLVNGDPWAKPEPNCTCSECGNAHHNGVEADG